MARLLSTLLLLLSCGTILGLAFRLCGRTSGEDSLYVWQAAAWLHGRTDIDHKLIDVAHWEGRYFVPFPPFPSLLVLPVVALLGVAPTNTLWLTLVLATVSASALWRLGDRLALDTEQRLWLIAALLFGTGFANVLLFGHSVWFFAHGVSFTSLLLAMVEGLGRRRGWVLGLLLTASFLSRQMTAGALFFFVPLLWPQRRALGELLGLFSLGVLGYLWYNAVRFGSPWNTGYGLLELQGPLAAKAARYGLFHPAYLPFNLAYLLLQGPHLIFGGPELRQVQGVSVYGTALPLASPFLLLGLTATPRVTMPKSHLIRIGVAAGVILLPTLFYYNNGYQQLNCQRFTLDFLPLLAVPVALGLQKRSSGVWRSLILWSVGLNAVMLPFGTPS